MSTSSSSVDKQDKYESEFSEFLLRRLGNAGGSLQLQHITGHLSQLSYDIRCTIGTSKSDLLNFLKRHNNLFSIHDGVVSIIDSSSSLRDDDYDSDSSSIGQQSSLPLTIKKGKGVVTKIFKEFGFIKAKEPVKTEVYFKAINFGNYDTDLSACLYTGTMVYFHAKKKTHDDNRSKYCAIKVWKVDECDMHSSTVVQKSRKNRDTGLYDPMTLDSEGVIQNVFPNLGFIAVKGDENNTVFFHKNHLLKYDNIVDLTKVLLKGDIVEFTAHRSTKQDTKARWEATKVWKKSGKIKEKNASKIDSSRDNHSSLSKIDMKNGNSAREMIKNQRGKICPRSRGAVIKFGKNELADGDAAAYYISGSRVTDISWEFSEGDDVFFDAVKIKSAPGWKAVLVWVDEKPDIVLPTCLGDFSEFTDEETEDNLSSYVSNSSNSSMKSVSIKSDCSSSKSRELQQEIKTTSSLSNFVVNRDTKKCNKKEYKIRDSSSQYGSQSSLSSSVTSKCSQRSRREHKKEISSLSKFLSSENKSISSWGDSPYPADENYQNISASDNNVSDLPQKLTLSKTVTVPNEEVQSISGLSSSVEEEQANEKIEDGFSNSLEEINNEKKEISESSNNLQETASIRKFQRVEGKIVKVYSKFAEVNAGRLQNTVSFFWNDFFYNGVSVEELDLEDLKQVLKVGETIHFNYFEIVDDLGQNWQKVSLAWNGPTPIKTHEMSPEDFIKQNNLTVSIKSETIIDPVEEKVVLRKFLTAVEDFGPEKLADKISRTESCSEDESPTSEDHSKVFKQPNEALSPVDYKMMSSAIIQILKKDLFPADSKVDFFSVSKEIISIVLENQNVKEHDDEFCQTLLPDKEYGNKSSGNTCTDYGKSCASKSCVVNTKNSEVQTIITGEIIAQNIFTEC